MKATATAPLLSVRGLAKHFPVRSGVLRRTVGQVRAVDGVDLEIQPGQTLGLVGESGSGKSTTARLITRLIEPSGGEINFDGTDLGPLSSSELRAVRRRIQMVFQDPYASLSPRLTVAQIVGEPLRVHRLASGADLDARVVELLGQVGLDASGLDRYPHEFSGGQRQRIAVARALAVGPDLVVCDEPVSALDVSIQSQVINLLADLQAEQGLAYLFISHDLSVVRHVSDRIAVMYLGRIVEEGPAEAVHDHPTHPYTQALLSAIPVPDPVRQRSRRRIVLQGDVPSPLDPPAGCHFHPRCPYVMDVCRSEDPPAFALPDGGRVHCHLHTDGPRLAGASVRTLDLEARRQREDAR
jgi:oligopeptide transport system ATP-binding protein